MTWRKWMVRGLVFSVLGTIAAVALMYQAWTNPTATRRQVLGQLEKTFAGAHVSLESARLRLLGGISFSELRMARRDDLEKTDFLYVPAGVIYHDKERLANGDLAVRKVELLRPRLRIVRDRDGRWNLADLLAPGGPNQRVPTLVLQQATIIFEDHTTPLAGPLLEIKDVNLTLVNDPLPTLTVEGGGVTDVAGPVRISGTIQRASGDLTFEVEAAAIPVGPPLVQRLAAVAPDAAAQVRTLRGEGRVKATVTHRPAAPRPLGYDATLTLTRGEFSHPRVPWAFQEVEATARVVNGTLPAVHVAARSGPTHFDLTLKDLTLPKNLGASDECPSLNDLARELDVTCEHVPVNHELFTYLPENLREYETDYSPSGFLTVTHTFRKEESGRWHKRWLLTGENMRASYQHFKYGVERITGTLDVAYDNELLPVVKLDLRGYSGDRPVTLKGTVTGDPSHCGVEIDIEAERVPLDQKLLKALPADTRKVVEQFLPDKSRPQPGAQFQPMGQGDFKVMLRRRRGVDEFSRWFFITFHDAALRYVVFPYPLEEVTGVLELHPDHWEAKDFRGAHHGGEFRFSGRSYPMPGGHSVCDRPEWVRVELHGRNVKLDDPDFLAALRPRQVLEQAWDTLNIAGQMNFDAEVIDVPGQPQEDGVDVSVTIDGCRMKPTFFDYAMRDVSGTFRYLKERVYLTDVKAKHGASVLSLKRGQIILKPSGGFQARLDAIQGAPVVPDDDFLHALPVEVREGLKALKLKSPLYAGTALIIDVPGDPKADALVWWDGGAYLRDATLQTGVEVGGVNGLVTCCGQKKGADLQLVGNLGLETATVLGQPVQDFHARFDVRPDSPGVLRFHDLTARLFGGDVGGEGRVEFGPTLKYETTLKALNVRLEQFGRHNFGPDADVQGPVSAALHLMGEGRDVGGLKGRGRVFVRDAKLYKLPALLDLVKAFGLRLPDRTAFEQAGATFVIDGPQVRFEQIDLVGNAISLRGQGTADLDGSNLNLDFNADWARLGQFLPEATTEIPRWVSDQLWKVKVRGRVGEMRFEPEVLPWATEPIKSLFSGEK
jgi:hypothetical protein